MFKIEPVNLHEQFASDYLRLLKIYFKKIYEKLRVLIYTPPHFNVTSYL